MMKKSKDTPGAVRGGSREGVRELLKTTSRLVKSASRWTSRRVDSRSGETPATPARDIALNNKILNRFTPAERVNIGVHTCPGGNCDFTHSGDVPCISILSTLFDRHAGFFLIQLASEKDKESVYRDIGKHLKKDQVVFIGVIDPLNPRVETPEEVAADLVLAAKYIPKEQLGATDDCGF